MTPFADMHHSLESNSLSGIIKKHDNNYLWPQKGNIMKQWIPMQFLERQAKTNVTISLFFMLMIISLLTVLYTSPSQAACMWAGEWEISIGSTYGEHTDHYLIEQNGSQVIVDNFYGDGGNMVGTASGDTVRFPFCNTLNGECVRPGHYVFTMQSDCDHFTGFCEFEDEGPCITTFSGVRVNIQNKPPEVSLSYSPSGPVVGKPITFSAFAFDIDGDKLRYEWYLDGVQQGDNSPSFTCTCPSAGTYSIRVVVSDGRGGKAEDITEFVVNDNKPYVITPGLNEGKGEPWGQVKKVLIDGKQIDDVEQQLYTGSQIITGPGVKILIYSPNNGGTIWVRENTQYEMKVIEHADPDRKAAYGRLFKGVCDFYFPPNQKIYEKFQVEAKRAIVTIKGTTFTVSDIDGITTVEVEEGSVEVTHLDTCAVSTVKAGESLFIFDNCRFIYDDLSMSIPCAEYYGFDFGFDLNFYENPADPSGLYWKMDIDTLTEGTGFDCIPLSDDLSLPICCAEFYELKLSFTLDFYENPADPSGFYWKMDINTLKEVERLGNLGSEL